MHVRKDQTLSIVCLGRMVHDFSIDSAEVATVRIASEILTQATTQKAVYRQW